MIKENGKCEKGKWITDISLIVTLTLRQRGPDCDWILFFLMTMWVYTNTFIKSFDKTTNLILLSALVPLYLQGPEIVANKKECDGLHWTATHFTLECRKSRVMFDLSEKKKHLIITKSSLGQRKCKLWHDGTFTLWNKILNPLKLGNLVSNGSPDCVPQSSLRLVNLCMVVFLLSLLDPLLEILHL